MEPLSTGARPVSVFVSALYSPAVQNILQGSEESLRRLWDQVLEIAASSQQKQSVRDESGTPGLAEAGVMNDPASRVTTANGNRREIFSEQLCCPRVRHVVKLVLALRGSAVAMENSSVLDILEVGRVRLAYEYWCIWLYSCCYRAI